MLNSFESHANVATEKLLKKILQNLRVSIKPQTKLSIRNCPKKRKKQKKETKLAPNAWKMLKKSKVRY